MLAALTTSDLNLLIAPVQVSHTYIIGPGHVCAFIYPWEGYLVLYEGHFLRENWNVHQNYPISVNKKDSRINKDTSRSIT
jgi:hypothetical protein